MASSQTSSNWKVHNNAQVQTRLLQSYTSPSGLQNYVPFLARANRFAFNKQDQLNPPIGSYNLPSCFDNKKSYLQERVNQFLLEAEKKKQQMGIFKSSINRFERVVKQVPGPASYNLFNKDGRKEEKTRYSLNKQKKVTDQGKTCPSIPHKENRYGYSINNGKIKTIQKNEEVILKEKESRKEYLATLERQNTLMRNSFSESYCHTDQKKKLYQETGKMFGSTSTPEHHFSKTLLTYKKPKHQHLYHSKGVQPSNNQQLLGPGSYQPRNNAFNIDNRKQKYQFFGSTEMRFKDKTNYIQKGYPLIEMIKDKRKEQLQQKKSFGQNKAEKNYEKKVIPEPTMPGPGEYNPNDEVLKKSRGNAFFTNSQRFQGMYSKPDDTYDQNEEGDEVVGRKSPKIGKLKKDRFKPLQKVYNPVSCSQICGILSNPQQTGKQNRKAAMEKMKNDFEMQNIDCWSRQGKREDLGCEYMRQLKEELAFINQTSRDQIQKQKYSKTKKSQD